MTEKDISEIGIHDLRKHPVWEYVGGSTKVRPVTRLPAESLQGRIVGLQVQLSSGAFKWAILSNVSLSDARSTSQFITVSVENAGTWFDLARYFDVDYEDRDSRKLADFLGLHPDEVFPLSYDISAYAIGLPQVVKGIIPSHPEERLSQDQLIDLALEHEPT